MDTLTREQRTTYQGILNLSGEYIEAFKLIQNSNEKITYLFHAKFYLLAHSIELSFKAYLRYNGYKLNKLKNIGHDLEAIYNELSSNYLYRLDRKTLAIIKSINMHYKNKEFEYPVTGVKNVADIKELAIVAEMVSGK